MANSGCELVSALMRKVCIWPSLLHSVRDDAIFAFGATPPCLAVEILFLGDLQRFGIYILLVGRLTKRTVIRKIRFSSLVLGESAGYGAFAARYLCTDITPSSTLLYYLSFIGFLLSVPALVCIWRGRPSTGLVTGFTPTAVYFGASFGKELLWGLGAPVAGWPHGGWIRGVIGIVLVAGATTWSIYSLRRGKYGRVIELSILLAALGAGLASYILFGSIP
jgi:hypothetical protein